MLKEPLSQYAPARPHHGIEEVFDDIFLVAGTARFGPGITFNRNMVIVRDGGALSVISPIRLSDEGEKSLTALGPVRHVIRLGAHHGVDDAYYVDKFDAKFWCADGPARYPAPAEPNVLTEGGPLPFENAWIHLFAGANKGEGALLIGKNGGLLVTCDSLQSWSDWGEATILAKLIMMAVGFKMTTIVGPPWKKDMTPPGGDLKPDFERLLALEFDHHIGAHGSLKRGGAKESVRAAVDAAFGG